MPAQPPFAPGQSYNTALDPLSEMMFRKWVSENNVPFNADAQGATDYDMRGYWQGLQRGNPMAKPSQVNPNDNQPHFTDYYKTPLHETFSRESQWADQNAPQWINDHQLANSSGRILFDEQAQQSPLLKLLQGRQ